MTAVPLDLPAGGRNTVSEGLWMFLYHQSLCCSGSSRRASKPGAPFSHNRMTFWAGASGGGGGGREKKAGGGGGAGVCSWAWARNMPQHSARGEARDSSYFLS